MPPHQAEHDARFRLAMASAGIGMAIVSLDGEWVDVNPALCRMFGYPAVLTLMAGIDFYIYYKLKKAKWL